MPWLKMDDNFITNAKLLGVGIEAKLLYIWALGFCAKELTDGNLKESQVRAVAGLAGLPDWEAAALQLTGARLWEVRGDDYRVHDYLDYNPCREEALALRQIRAEAGSVGGHRSVESRREAKAQANALANAKQNSTPDPVPDPVPDPDPVTKKKTKTDAAASGAQARGDGLHQQRFAVLARGCGHDPANLGDSEAKAIGVAASGLRKFSPDQIQAMCSNFHSHYPGLSITPGFVAKNGSKLLQPGPFGHLPPRSPNGRPNSGGSAKGGNVESGGRSADEYATDGTVFDTGPPS